MGGVGLCTKTCLEECPDGWGCRGIGDESGGVVFYCYPESDRLCQPCSAHIRCPGEKNLCLDIGGFLNCAQDCENNPCPPTYDCVDSVSIEGVSAKQCVPKSGFCQCTSETVGDQYPCQVENEFGSCPGVQTCLEDGSLSACDGRTPEAESCDGVDNDCDGFVDEDLETIACQTTNEQGSCDGTQVCVTDVGLLCNAPEPTEETCDGQDNDCDGLTDEDFTDDNGEFTLLEHCQGCNQSCLGLFAHAQTVECDASGDVPKCAVVSCDTGYVKSQSGLCIPLVHHICEGCVDYSNCLGPNDRCLKLSPTDTQKFCGRDCGPDNIYAVDCPQGYTCAEIDLDGETVEQCVPQTGTCDCNQLSAGLTKPCAV